MTAPTIETLSRMIRKLLNTCELNLDDLEPATIEVIDEARDLIADEPEDESVKHFWPILLEDSDGEEFEATLCVNCTPTGIIASVITDRNNIELAVAATAQEIVDEIFQ